MRDNKRNLPMAQETSSTSLEPSLSSLSSLFACCSPFPPREQLFAVVVGGAVMVVARSGGGGRVAPSPLVVLPLSPLSLFPFPLVVVPHPPLSSFPLSLSCYSCRFVVEHP